jgi:hypothetical protein
VARYRDVMTLLSYDAAEDIEVFGDTDLLGFWLERVSFG